MKKLISILLSVIMVTGIFTSLPLSSFAAAKKVRLKKSSATLKIAEKKGKAVYGKTSVKVKKSKGLKVKKITYKSSDKKIASVSKKGKVTAKAKGSTKIKVKVKYTYKNRSRKASLTFKVKVKDLREKKTAPASSAPTSQTTEAYEPAAPTDANPADSSEPKATDPSQPFETEGTSASIPVLDTTSATVSQTDTELAPYTTEQEVTETSAEQVSESEPYIPEPEPIEYEETEPEVTEPVTTEPSATKPADNTEKSFSEKLSAFSNKLYKMSAENEDGNYTMSPISVYMAFSMLYSVGNDKVKADIEELVGMNEADFAKTGELFKSLVYKYVYNDEVITQLHLTNSLWLDNNVTANEDAVKKLEDELYCEVFNTPFKDDNESANQAIQDYIRENTNGKINQNFGLSRETVFALINTLYLKDIWDIEQELNTTEEYFKTDNGIKSCEFLNGKYIAGKTQENDTSYYFYTTTSSGYKVKFILPKDGVTLSQAMSEKNLNEVNLNKDYNVEDPDGTRHFTKCVFPSFKIESDTPLKSILKNNNFLSDAFNGFYSPLVNDNVMVSDIKHKAVVEANKKGIEGAAVTIIANEATSIMPEPNPEMYHKFVLNRNFGFIITDPKDVILFEGQVKDPQPEREIIKQDDFDFSLRFNTFGTSYYDSKTGTLIKTNDVINRSAEEYKTIFLLSDEQKAEIKKAVEELNIESYPDKYNPYGPLSSAPSETMIFTVGDKTISCEGVSLGGEAEDEKAQKFLDVINMIKKYIYSSAQWRSLPDYEVLYD